MSFEMMDHHQIQFLARGARRRCPPAQAGTNPAHSQTPGAVPAWIAELWRARQTIKHLPQATLTAPGAALQHIFNTSQLHQCRELWHHFHFAHGGCMRSASKTTSVFPLGIGKEPVVFQMEDKGKSRLRPLLVPKAFSAALSSCSQLVSPTSPQPAQGRHPLYFSTGVSGNQHRQPRLEANIKFPIKIQYCNCLQIKEK